VRPDRTAWTAAVTSTHRLEPWVATKYRNIRQGMDTPHAFFLYHEGGI
jgi:hypothetical protein